MKILVLGSSGFIGKNVQAILSAEHEVYGTSRSGGQPGKEYALDLSDPEAITSLLKKLQPKVIINCAGVVDKTEKAMLNPLFTENLLRSVLGSRLNIERIVISGSAAEYGLVDKKDIPVREDAALNADSGYGLSKLKETKIALDYRQKHHLPIIVVRIFNPIGAGMNPNLLLPSLLRQISQIKEGQRESIEVSRLDTRRDYLDVEDVALAIKGLLENQPIEAIYNIGSGKSTSNQELIDLMLKSSKLEDRPRVVETSAAPEPLVAIQADISRINNELGWKPKKTLQETIQKIIDAPHKRSKN